MKERKGVPFMKHRVKASSRVIVITVITAPNTDLPVL